ncbi:hypothetical protein EYZ11_008080 [Aspergillus tanneri]|uniref:Indole-diterpene biosynthesis protein PaxU n=1 Tax=Aspergillus tanneri TaxID=1220188 RepID=A0A4S3JDJ1_9EURO|nr:uncharacterized protein ATNIH1004_002136 [Aspergillus tanneri]KAA8649465.1 hypothetical protein ATNIH1004_002136 [Aspergillus tanneri]THC92438.1 hypothetical protein EYZ11_008080 [Aspergillus tanneri]
MTQVFPQFEPLGLRTWLCSPEKPHPGQLVVICTWLGASPKHIAKYVDLHRSIAPHARILLIESEVAILVSSYAYQRRAIQPAARAICNSLAESSSNHPPKILLHTFSNGGTNTATQLLITLRETLHEPLPLIGLVLDSTPAKGTYWKSYDAMVFSLPPSGRIFGSAVIHALLVVLYAWIACGNENPASLMRRTLLDDKTICPGDKVRDAGVNGNICYLYSKTDRMTDWHDVRDHADDARQKGWNVQEVLFDGSGHCAHMAQDSQKYSKAVKRVWDMTIGRPVSKL